MHIITRLCFFVTSFTERSSERFLVYYFRRSLGPGTHYGFLPTKNIIWPYKISLFINLIKVIKEVSKYLKSKTI